MRARSTERVLICAQKTRAYSEILRARSQELRRDAHEQAARFVGRLRGRAIGRPLGDFGDTFVLHVAQLDVAVGLVRSELSRWLEQRGVGYTDRREIALACSEACANAVEHPVHPARRKVEVRASHRDDAVEVVVRDFGGWRPKARDEADGRGRGLSMIRAVMDDVYVEESERGTVIGMRRRLALRG
jgi:anti-sigma regulatory factor (Ser/Thr protein kinase)